MLRVALSSYTWFVQVISLEGWADIMYYIQDVHTFWVWMYFVTLIVVSHVAFLCLCVRLNGYNVRQHH
jgi:ABC-type multidrug transport system permease subunit